MKNGSGTTLKWPKKNTWAEFDWHFSPSASKGNLFDISCQVIQRQWILVCSWWQLLSPLDDEFVLRPLRPSLLIFVYRLEWVKLGKILRFGVYYLKCYVSFEKPCISQLLCSFCTLMGNPHWIPTASRNKLSEKYSVF